MCHIQFFPPHKDDIFYFILFIVFFNNAFIISDCIASNEMTVNYAPVTFHMSLNNVSDLFLTTFPTYIQWLR